MPTFLSYHAFPPSSTVASNSTWNLTSSPCTHMSLIDTPSVSRLSLPQITRNMGNFESAVKDGDSTRQVEGADQGVDDQGVGDQGVDLNSNSEADGVNDNAKGSEADNDNSNHGKSNNDGDTSLTESGLKAKKRGRPLGRKTRKNPVYFGLRKRRKKVNPEVQSQSPKPKAQALKSEAQVPKSDAQVPKLEAQKTAVMVQTQAVAATGPSAAAAQTPAACEKLSCCVAKLYNTFMEEGGGSEHMSLAFAHVFQAQAEYGAAAATDARELGRH